MMSSSVNQALPVSVVVPVRNEEENIQACLASLSWAGEVFVVDSRSTDRTAALAEEMGAQVVQFTYDGGWPKKKNWAIQNLPFNYAWIMIVDADERVTTSLHEEIREAVNRHDINGYYVCWKFYFLGRWMKHSWRHGWMLRLFRKGEGAYEDLGMRGQGGWDNEVHENIVVNGPTACLQAPLEHHSNKSLSYWIQKQNEFSDWNAVRRLQQRRDPFPPLSALFSGDPLRRRKFLKAVYVRIPCKPVFMFLYLYVIQRGWLDGRAGFYFCMLRAVHEFNINAKIYEQRHVS